MSRSKQSIKINKQKGPAPVILPGTRPAPIRQARASLPKLQHTQAGAEWLRKYLNPNGELAAKTTAGRVPDGTCKRSGVFNIHKYTALSCPNVAHEGNWSLFAFSTNTIWISHIFIADLEGRSEINDAGIALVSKWINSWDNSTHFFNQWQPASNNNIIYCYVQVDSAFSQYAIGAARPKSDFIKVRQTYKGDTYRFTGSTLENQGQCITAKYSCNYDNVTLNVFPSSRKIQSTSDEVDGYYACDADVSVGNTALVKSARNLYADIPTTLERISLIDIPPLNVGLLTEADPAAYSGRASSGVYTVNYNTKDDFNWHTMGDNRFLYLSSSFAPNVSTELMGGQLIDIVSPLWDVGVTVFSAIDPKATIQLESRRGVEFVSAVGGSYANLQSDAPLYDPMPVNLAKSIAMTLKSGYPSAYNDWGKLWGAIKGVLPTVVGAIPGVGGFLGPMVTPVVNAVENMLGGHKNGPPAGDAISGNPTNNGRLPRRR